MSVQLIDWDLALIQKYNYSGPRYTSYPTALEFSPEFGAAEFDEAVARYPQRPLSLYVHIPFCHKLCYFCGCNKIVTRQQHKPKSEKPMLSPQAELELLENDERLDALLERLEEGGTLNAEEQSWVDAKLDRIDELMQQLGLSYDDEDEEEEERQEDMMRLLKGGN